MKKLLNTLYVTTPGLYLRKDGQAIEVRKHRELVTRLPILNLDGIVLFEQTALSGQLMNFCALNDILITHLDRNGRFLARIEGPVSGNVLLRREQFRAADNPERTGKIARNVLLGKLANTKNVLLRFLRDHPATPHTPEIEGAANFLRELIKKMRRQTDPEILRGIEGAAAERYFSVFDHLITNEHAAFRFAGRSRRPPLDAVNALLSLAYTLLTHDLSGALEAVGLDPAVGFLHTDRPGRVSLALDMQEEFRSFWADRLVLTLLNLKQLTPGDFRTGATGAVQLTDRGRKIFLTAYQARKREEVRHPLTGEKMAFGLLPFLQARLLAKHLRGELSEYPPLVWR